MSEDSRLDASEIFGALRDGVVTAGRDGRIESANQTVAELLGTDAASLVGSPLEHIVPERFRAQHRDAFERWARTGVLTIGGQQLRVPARRYDGTEVDVELTLHAIQSGIEQMVIGFLRPAVVEGATHGRLAHELVRLVGTDLPMPRLLEQLMAALAEQLRWEVGLVWLWNERSGSLEVAASWPEAGDSAYVRESIRHRFAPGIGHVGVSFDEGHIAWVDDLSVSDVFERSGVAVDLGLRAALFFPLRSGDEVIGVAELVTSEHRGIDLATHEAVEVLSTELGGVIEQRRELDEVRAERQRLELALESAGMGVWTWDLATDRVDWSADLASLHGMERGSFGGDLASFVTVAHPDDRHHLRARLEQARADGARFEYLYRTDPEAGPSHWIEGSGQGLVDSDGRLTSVTGVSVDVTESVEFATELEQRVVQASLAADVGTALTGDRDLSEKLTRCTEAVVEHVGAAFARIWTLAPGSDELHLIASSGIYTHLDGGHARIPVGAYKIGRIASDRRPHLTNDVVGDPEVSDREWARREGMVSFAGYPLVVADRCVGVLGLFAREPLSASTLQVLETVADMIGLAIEEDRANDALLEAYHRSRQESEERASLAAVLQQSLLPPELPAIPNVELGCRYVAATHEVGGDFYDVFPLRGRTWGFVVGDVCGKGPDAAWRTSLARHSVRTAAMLQRRVDQALRALNDAMLTAEGGYCTALFGRMRARAGGLRVQVACAGHPAAFVARLDRTVERVEGGGPMVGVFPTDAMNFDDIELDLAVGDRLVLYTDGITEARRDGEEFGEERLRTVLQMSTTATAQGLADEIVDAARGFGGGDRTDDMAVLVIGVTPPA